MRFNLDNVKGPITNPDQLAIDPSFVIQYRQPQRNAGLNYTRTVSPHFTSETSLGYIRSTPLFLPENLTQPGMTFSDSLYESFNGPAGTVGGFYGNLYQFRQNFTYVRGTHTLKFGVEFRANRAWKTSSGKRRCWTTWAIARFSRDLPRIFGSQTPRA